MMSLYPSKSHGGGHMGSAGRIARETKVDQVAREPPYPPLTCVYIRGLGALDGCRSVHLRRKKTCLPIPAFT
ncbi:hypothetical protein FHS27_002110 [Rhodopirellula rubra]|uniref:Uncharacterized protein n=1 Tax=Aporhodopirellula rubra TaxID=980271 RepID=A0A7W5H5X6_9BACT|nr:hypothetical protein [Aporhodopirellula rubra]